MTENQPLPQNDDRATSPLGPKENFQEASQRLPHILDKRIPHAIRFIGTGLNHIFSVDVSDMMVVGRRNSMKDMEVVVDLSSFDAYKMGVSRFHAMILTLDKRVTIKDLNSLNGTRLNDLDLQPSREYLLEHGDKVTFGKLSFLVQFEY